MSSVCFVFLPRIVGFLPVITNGVNDTHTTSTNYHRFVSLCRTVFVYVCLCIYVRLYQKIAICSISNNIRTVHGANNKYVVTERYYAINYLFAFISYVNTYIVIITYMFLFCC